MKALLIAEKNSLMRDVQSAIKQYGFKDDIECMALHGHICGIKEPDKMNEAWGKWSMATLPMIPEKWEYSAIDKECFDRIKKALNSGQYDYVINCTDPEREGQHIFYAVYNLAQCKLPVKRMWHADQRAEELKRALDCMKDDLKDPFLKNLTTAAFLRAQLDWLIGMNCTRAVSLNNRKVIRLGRVMSPVLFMIVERELSIRNFVQSTSYDCEANFGGYKGVYVDQDSESGGAFKSKAEYDAFVNKATRDGIVKSVETKQTKDYAPQFYSTAQLQQDCNSEYGYTVAESAAILQTLYESKLITYPRTDCAYISKGIAQDLKKTLHAATDIAFLKPYIDKISDSQYKAIVSNTKYVNDAKLGSHTAIILTGKSFDYQKLDKKQQSVLFLIARQMTAVFYPPTIMSKTVIFTECGKDLYKTNGSMVADMGYAAIYEKNFDEVSLPTIQKGEKVNIANFNALERVTKPPVRFNDATLLKAMINAAKYVDDKDLQDVLNMRNDENAGIGTPASRTGIIEKLVQPYKSREQVFQFCERKKKVFVPTDFAIDVIQSLNKSTVISPALTAKWEKKLLDIEQGAYSEATFRSEMAQYITSEVDLLKKTDLTNKGASGSVKELGINCPKCNKPILESDKGYFCSGFKDATPCDLRMAKSILGAPISKDDFQKLISGQKSSLLTMKKKTSKDTFKAFLTLDIKTGKLEFASSNEVAEADIVGKCPKCGKPAVKRSGQYGKFITCENRCFVFSESVGKHKLKKAEIGKILAGDKTDVLELTKKDGGTFKASLSLGDDGKLKYDFAK